MKIYIIIVLLVILLMTNTKVVLAQEPFCTVEWLNQQPLIVGENYLITYRVTSNITQSTNYYVQRNSFWFDPESNFINYNGISPIIVSELVKIKYTLAQKTIRLDAAVLLNNKYYRCNNRYDLIINYNTYLPIISR